MVVNITFKELSEYVAHSYGQQIGFKQVSDKTLCVTMSKKVMFVPINIDLNLTIEGVLPDAVVLAYDGGIGVDMIITGALTVLKARVPQFEQAVICAESHRLKICLSKIEQTKSIVEALAIDDIMVNPDGLSLTAHLK